MVDTLVYRDCRELWDLLGSPGPRAVMAHRGFRDPLDSNLKASRDNKEYRDLTVTRVGRAMTGSRAPLESVASRVLMW